MKVTIKTGLEKPATMLIEKFSSAAGILYEPVRIRRKANAEATAKVTSDKILVKGEIEARELAMRASQRFTQKVINQQENIEAIIDEAIPLLNENAKSEDIDKDWLNRFVDCAEKVSGDDARQLWSKILAGEANKPKSFSIRTLNTLSFLGPIEANLIRMIANLTLHSRMGFALILPINFDKLQDLTKLNQRQIWELQSLGIISIDTWSGYHRTEYHYEQYIGIPIHEELGDVFVVSLNESPPDTFPQERKYLIGCGMLTQLGQELMSLVDDVDRSDLLVWLNSDANNLTWKLEQVKETPS